MKTTLEWIDETKTRLALTDYGLAKRLGISTSLMSNYRTGKHVISENHAILLGEAMGIDPMPIVAAAAYERSKADHIKAFWARHAEAVGMAAVGFVLAGTLITAPAPAQAAGAGGSNSGPSLYIM